MLFREYLRVINEVRPRYVVLENVTGFMDTRFYGFEGVTGHRYPDGEIVPNILINEFQLIGYHTLQHIETIWCHLYIQNQRMTMIQR